MRILGARGAVTEHRYPQREITGAFADTMMRGEIDRGLLERLHRNAGVSHRHLALPLEEYGRLEDFGQANDAFIDVGVDLGARAVTDALKEVGLTPTDVDMVISTTVTGLAVPTLDARIAALIGLRPDVVRVPLFGLGCVAGAAGVARLHDYLLGHPDSVAVLLSVELCSLTIQRDDTSVTNLVASGLFGDGAAAVVAAGERRAREHVGDGAGPETPSVEVLASRSRLYPDSQRVMGWDVGAGGLRIVLDPRVPEVVRSYLRGDVDEFLADHGLTRADVRWWVAHPGGPKVLEALEDTLQLDRAALQLTWDSLDAIGNLSSASVMHVLADTLRDRPPPAGSYGMMLAMGPGFCSELVLMRASEPVQ